MKRLSLGLCLTVLACGGPEKPPPDPIAVSDPGPATMTFQVHVKEGAMLRAVAPGETLHSGDKIALSVTLDREAYVYILQFFPDGTSAVLFPESAAENNRITGTARVPASDWFQLDDNLGEENLYIVASLEPLSKADQTVSKLVDTVRVSGTAGVPDPGSTGTATGTADAAPAAAAPDPPDAGETGTEPAPASDAGVGAVGSGNRAKTTDKPPRRRRKRARPSPGRADMNTRGIIRVKEDGDNAAIEAETDADGVVLFRFHFVHAAPE